MSLRQLADAAGLNVSVVRRAELGRDARMSTWDKIFEGLGYYLLRDVNERSEEAGGLIAEEKERRILRQLDGLLSR